MKSGETLLWERFKRLGVFYIFLVVLLASIGFAMQYSAAEGNLMPWAWPQILRFLMMLPVMLLIALIDIRLWFRYAYVLYGIGLILLMVVEVAGFVGMGAKRWINLGGMNFQPSEMMKVLLVLALSRFFHSIHTNEVASLPRLILPVIMVILPAVLILMQPNLGTASILMFLGASIFFVSGVGWKKFAVVAVIGLASLPILWHHMHDYQKGRVLTFLNPARDPLGAGYNILQSEIAIGSGGVTGKGFGKGSQSQLDFLPEKQTDFIFTMIGEEQGFIGGVGILLLYGLIILYGLRISLQSQSFYGKTVAFGMTTILSLHVLINIAMVMGMIPVVGVPLPMLSYGGSSLIAMMMAFGFILNAEVYSDELVRRTVEID